MKFSGIFSFKYLFPASGLSLFLAIACRLYRHVIHSAYNDAVRAKCHKKILELPRQVTRR